MNNGKKSNGKLVVESTSYKSLPKSHSWHIMYLSGRVAKERYSDSHCIFHNYRDHILDMLTVVAPNGVRLTRGAYILLCTIPFYANHHEHESTKGKG